MSGGALLSTEAKVQISADQTTASTTPATTESAASTSAAATGIPEDIYPFIKPPLCTPSKPTLVSKTDSSMVIQFEFNSTDPLEKAIDVTNVTKASSIVQLTGGKFPIFDGTTEGLGTNNTEWYDLHPILGQYATKEVNLTLPVFQTIPEGKARVFLRKPVKRFMIEVQPVSADEKLESIGADGWELAASIDVSETKAEVEGLHPGKGYHIRVCSANTAGKGACGMPAMFRTADVPATPLKVKLSEASTQSLLVEVDKPATVTGAPLTEIELEYSRRHSGPWEKLTFDLNDRKKLVTDLEPGATYFFRSRAWNRIGPSQYSDPASFETLSMVPKPVSEFRITKQTSDIKAATTIATLEWSAPDPRGRPITDYEVQKAFGFSTEESNFLLETLTESLNCTIKGLEAGKMYHFRVRAMNDVGAGNWSQIIELIAAPSVPTSPLDLTLLESSPRSLELEWTKPADYHGSLLLNYLLQMQTVEGNTTANTTLTPAAAKSTKPAFWNDVYKGLSTHVTLGADIVSPARTYLFRVKALNAVGSSEPSVVKQFSTPSTEPDAPSAPTALRVTPETIFLRWNIPAANGAPVLSYRVNMAPKPYFDAYIQSMKNQSAATPAPAMQFLLAQSSHVLEEGVTKSGQRWITGSGSRTHKPCKAIHPSVYDRDIPEQYRTPAIIPGSQKVYPVKPGTDRQLPNEKPVPPPSLNITATPARPKPQPRGDGFSVVYEGPLNEAIVTGLFPGNSYVFTVQATNSLGTSAASEYAAIQTTPTVPSRPKGAHIENRGHNFLSFSWTPSQPRGTPVTSYIAQISGGKDRFGNAVFENICANDFPPSLGGDEFMRNFTTRPEPSADAVGVDGAPMDHCKPRPVDETSTEKALVCCVEGLEREKVYQIRIIAVSALGLSDFGPTADMSTRGEVPQTPLPPQVTTATPTSISLIWSAPPSGVSSANALTYHVHMASHENGVTQEVFVGNRTNATVSGLTANTTYWFRIQAENTHGVGLAGEFSVGMTCLSDISNCLGKTKSAVTGEVVLIDRQEEAREDELMETQLALDAKLRKVSSRMNAPPHVNSRLVKHHRA
eukprot:c8915_g1_i1.p1 GENE.c8915_g1_i1~~c8915_g1_i1.p1  ORF type:complete len:1101 (-),score=299.19 c8915_g1_i1:157-3375(-)